MGPFESMATMSTIFTGSISLGVETGLRVLLLGIFAASVFGVSRAAWPRTQSRRLSLVHSTEAVRARKLAAERPRMYELVS
jgi:hypothetical protein